METSATAPIWRERIQLNHTVKDGWRVGEVTVEVTYADGDAPSDLARLHRLTEVVSRGQNVVDALNTRREVES